MIACKTNLFVLISFSRSHCICATVNWTTAWRINILAFNYTYSIFFFHFYFRQQEHLNEANGEVRITLSEGEGVIEGQVTVNDSDENILQQCICSTIAMCRQKLTETGFEPDNTEHKARILFPLTFIIFQLIYWIYYLFIAQGTGTHDIVQ